MLSELIPGIAYFHDSYSPELEVLATLGKGAERAKSAKEIGEVIGVSAQFVCRLAGQLRERGFLVCCHNPSTSLGANPSTALMADGLRGVGRVLWIEIAGWDEAQLAVDRYWAQVYDCEIQEPTPGDTCATRLDSTRLDTTGLDQTSSDST